MLGLMLSAQAPGGAQGDENPQPSSGPATLVLRDLEGRKQDLRDHRDSIVLVNFWATWCIPCREEMPIFVSLQKRYGQRGVRMIAVSTDDPRNKGAVARFAHDLKLNFPVWVGATTRDMQRLGLGEALPATAVIDREGRIVGRILGPVDRGDLKKRIEWLLDAPPSLVDTMSEATHDHAGDREPPNPDHHEHGEEHRHGGVGMEGASLVPS